MGVGGSYATAMTIALEIDQPQRLRGLLEKLLEEEGAIDRVAADVVFTPVTLTRLLLYVRDWNTNARYCDVAQAVLSFVLTAFTFEEIRRAVREAGSDANSRGNGGARSGGRGADRDGKGGGRDDGDNNQSGDGAVVLSDLVAGLIAYSERHLKRAARVYVMHGRMLRGACCPSQTYFASREQKSRNCLAVLVVMADFRAPFWWSTRCARCRNCCRSMKSTVAVRLQLAMMMMLTVLAGAPPAPLLMRHR